MEIINKRIEELIPYENNPRDNDNAVEYVANSIKEFGFKVPIVIDKNNTIVAGHTRYKASLELGLEEVPCIVADDLSEEQIKAFRLADNKVGEQASWNFELLEEELNSIIDINMDNFGFISQELEEVVEELENLYTTKINIPKYEITGEEPDFNEMVDKNKVNELIDAIEKSNITEEQKEFLKIAATRHYVFNYGNIAEYYAHQDKEMQKIMEKLALVIIDINDAISNGYVELSDKLEEMLNNEA